MDCLTSTNRQNEMSEFHLNRMRLQTSLSAPSESPLLHFRNSSFDDETSNDFNGCFLYARNNDDVIKEFRNVFLEKYLEKNRVGRKTKSKLKQSNSNSFTFDKCSKVLQFDTLDSELVGGSKNCADSSNVDVGNDKSNCSSGGGEIESFEEAASRFRYDPFLNGTLSNNETKTHYTNFSPVQIISHTNHDLSGRYQASSNYSSSSNDSSLSSVASSYLCSCSSFMESNNKQATANDFKSESLTLNGLKIQEEVELFDQSANHSTDYSQTSIWDHSNIYRMDNEITRMLFNFELDTTCGNFNI